MKIKGIINGLSTSSRSHLEINFMFGAKIGILKLLFSDLKQKFELYQ